MTLESSGLPGIKTERTAAERRLLLSQAFSLYLPAGKTVHGAIARDPLNVGDVDVLRAGMLMGKVTATGQYAPSVLGVLGVAYTGTQTQMDLLDTGSATELVRRCGVTGTFKITGPQVAGGKVRTRTVTYSAVGTGTPVNEVQTVVPNQASASGTYTLSVTLISGVRVTTAAIAFDATLAAAQTALNLAMGSSTNLIVLSSAGSAAPFSAGPISLVFTFSGTGYTAMDHPLVSVDMSALIGAGGVSTNVVTETTKGVPAANTVTVTALGIAAQSDIQVWTPAAAWTAGTIGFGFTNPDTGVIDWVQCLYTTDLAGTLAVINAAILAKFGVQIATATGGGNITSVTFTFLAGNATWGNRELPLVLVDYTSGTGAVTGVAATVVHSTSPGRSSGFIAGSLIQPTDGSEMPVGLLDEAYGLKVTDSDAASIDVPMTKLLVAGIIDTSQIINCPTDTSLLAWLKTQLNAKGRFIFDDDF